MKAALDAYSASRPIGVWSRSIVGVGPVMAAGLMAYIDIAKAAHVGHIYSFAGIANIKWNKGEKRPWCAALKVVCWKLGESFTKTANHKESVYGPVYQRRKLLEEARNNSGMHAELAAQKLAEKKYGKDTEAYKALVAGRLPQAQIHLRAQRYAVKLFLSHWHHVMHVMTYGDAPPPPPPYAIAHLGHADYIPPPNWPM